MKEDQPEARGGTRNLSKAASQVFYVWFKWRLFYQTKGKEPNNEIQICRSTITFE